MYIGAIIIILYLYYFKHAKNVLKPRDNIHYK